MDRFLRTFIKFHGYCIATVSCILTVVFTSIPTTSADTHVRWQDFVDLRFTGIPIVVFGFAWMVASTMLMAGIVKEKKSFLYPFCALFLIEVLLMLVRDLVLVITLDAWYRTIFFNLTLPLLLFVIPYVTMSMLALLRLFDVDPIVRLEDNFVRFDRSANEEVDSVTIRS